MTSTSKALCGDGFKCTGRTTTNSPITGATGGLCDTGNFCSRQALGLQPCVIGYYQPNTGQSSCIGCPAGYLCDVGGMSAPTTCSTGKYCPATTSSVTNSEVDCPAGTYNDRVNIGSADECIPCPPGQFCIAATAAKPTASPCLASFFCPYGATAADGYSSDYVFGLSAAGLCPAGYYCEEGTIAPTPCPIGKFRATSGGAALTDCAVCTAGWYCDELGMTALDDN
jgi:hypothetical protein